MGPRAAAGPLVRQDGRARWFGKVGQVVQDERPVGRPFRLVPGATSPFTRRAQPRFHVKRGPNTLTPGG